MNEFYRRYDESQRLTGVAGELERLRTMDIVSRYLSPPPAVVLDIGGGAGIHALSLAAARYQVHLVDPIAHHVAQASNASQNQRDAPLAGCAVGDARALPFPDGFADCVVLLGPLYHLTERADRLAALREAYRVLKPSGILFAGAISRFALLIDGFSQDFLADPAFAQILRRDLRDGQHHNPSGDVRYFTDAYFHLPDELRSEILEAAFSVEAIIGVEGPFWGVSGTESWSIPEARSTILDVLRQVEEQPALLGASAHFIAIGRRADPEPAA